MEKLDTGPGDEKRVDEFDINKVITDAATDISGRLYDPENENDVVAAWVEATNASHDDL